MRGMTKKTIESAALWLVAGAHQVLKALTNWVPRINNRDIATNLILQNGIITVLNRTLQANDRINYATAALAIEIDDFRKLEETNDPLEMLDFMSIFAERLQHTLRNDDIAARLEGPRFAVALSARRNLDLEASIQLCTRIQHALADPFILPQRNIYITVSIGFNMVTRTDQQNGSDVLEGARIALIEAQRGGPGAVRRYSPAMRTRIKSRRNLAGEVENAISNGHIQAYFQPQISLETNDISGFEALARWQHPKRGLIPPLEFLPALEEAGLMNQLGHAMLADVLRTMREWDDQGLLVPRVSINLSKAELRNPALVDHITMELDRFELDPERLAIEVLETVVATRDDDMVIQNLSKLAALGCNIDLDDFGTGHASITSIRRFSINRIKIDRSFVTKIDEDAEQQKMVAAILTMAERLGLDTLAEGVETEGERRQLANMQCGHLQGYSLARPMPRSETIDWIHRHQNRLLPHGHLRQVR